jgi:hypothetical protein
MSLFGREPERPAVDAEKLEKRVTDVVREILGKALADTESLLGKLRSSFDIAKHVTELREQLETLKIEKARKDEEFAKREREIEHKVGLERKRQEFEIQQSKREAVVSVQEENLKADRKRFEEQLKFHEDRFTQEVKYLKDMVTEVLKRLPTSEIKTNVEIKRRAS